MAWGCLFSDRYKAVLVNGADWYHCRRLVDYIQPNSARARLVLPDTMADRRRLVERQDLRVVEEGIKNCVMAVVPEKVYARSSH